MKLRWCVPVGATSSWVANLSLSAIKAWMGHETLPGEDWSIRQSLKARRVAGSLRRTVRRVEEPG